MAYATLVGHRDVQSVILGPYHLISALHWYHCYSHDWSVKFPPEKHISYHLTLDTLGVDSY